MGRVGDTVIRFAGKGLSFIAILATVVVFTVQIGLIFFLRLLISLAPIVIA
jgi:hypothetical protein